VSIELSAEEVNEEVRKKKRAGSGVFHVRG
jgi:hypothetical protein